MRTTAAHVSLFGHIKPCSDHCGEMRATAAACFFTRPYKSILRPFPWDYDNRRLMFDIGASNYAQTIVMRWGQQSPHVSLYGHRNPCSQWPLSWGEDKSAECFCIRPYKTMLRPSPWDYDNSRRMFDIAAIQNHAQTIVMRWQQQPPHVSLYGHTSATVIRWKYQSAHVALYSHIKPCSDLCHEITTTTGACLISEKCKTMLRPLSWGVDNSRRIFLYTAV